MPHDPGPPNMVNARRSWKRRSLIALASALAAWAIFAAWLLGTAWYRVPRYTPTSTPSAATLILTPEDYDAVIGAHARPYTYTLSAADGAGQVTVFGATHTKNPDDPQISQIRTTWRSLNPTIALIESDLGILFPAFMDPVTTFGEVGAVHALAQADNIPTYTWEPPDSVVIASALEQGFTLEQVALRWVLGPNFSNLRFDRPDDPDAFVLDTLSDRSAVDGIADVLTTIDDIDTAWTSAFPTGPDWRDVSDEYGLPGFLGDIDLNRPRDEHLVSIVAELIDAGERVFVICGLSHAVKIEPALKAIVR